MSMTNEEIRNVAAFVASGVAELHKETALYLCAEVLRLRAAADSLASRIDNATPEQQAEPKS